MPNSIFCLNQIPIFEWYVNRCGSKNMHQKDMCSKEIGLLAQDMIVILSLIINIFGGDLYGHLSSTRMFDNGVQHY